MTLTLKQRLLFLPGFTLLGLVALQATNSYVTQAISSTVIFPNLERLMLSGHENSLKAAVDIEAGTLGRRLSQLKTREEKVAAILADTRAGGAFVT